MSIEDRQENLIRNIDRIGSELGWSGWKIRGAQATAVLLCADSPSPDVSADPSKEELAALAQYVTSAMASYQLVNGPY